MRFLLHLSLTSLLGLLPTVVSGAIANRRQVGGCVAKANDAMSIEITDFPEYDPSYPVRPSCGSFTAFGRLAGHIATRCPTEWKVGRA